MAYSVPDHDAQNRPPENTCARCDAPLWGPDAEPDEWGHVICPRCWDWMERESRWKAARKSGIGASDASCILGLNPWKNKIQLWEEKTGRREAADIGGKPAVQYGEEAESHLRKLFALDYPEYTVSYDEFGMVSQPERPWLFATLDGALLERETARRGVLEIKTTEMQRSADWSKWDGRVPDYYYTQILHQLLATGYDFAILKAQIKWSKGDDMQLTTRHYRFERNDCLEDMEYLLTEEEKFWSCVTENKRPAGVFLPAI